MSVESARTFFEKVKSDDDFHLKVVKTGSNKEKRQQVIKDAGFDFTEEDWKTAKAELSDEDLDQVSGGCVHVCHNCCDFGFG